MTWLRATRIQLRARNTVPWKMQIFEISEDQAIFISHLEQFTLLDRSMDVIPNQKTSKKSSL